MPRPIITFTTDFGTGSPYVAEMKGVALSICPEANLVDISHAVPPQNVRYGALFLEQVVPSFPPGTIHLAVVDPGVGTQRGIVAAKSRGHLLVAPDNGLLSRVIPPDAPVEAVAATDRQYWRGVVSHTFHGRDIMAPLAAHLAAGVELSALGPPQRALVQLPWPRPARSAEGIRGEVLALDSFGNVISNIAQEDLAGRHVQQIRLGEIAVQGLVTCYGAQSPGEYVALIGSSGWLELALVEGDAAQSLAARVGDIIYVDC